MTARLCTTAALLFIVLTSGLGACKKKKAGNKGESSHAVTLDTGKVVPVYNDAHPSSCQAGGDPMPFSAVAGCPAAGVGERHDSEGQCFIDDTVTPEYTEEPPTSGPQYTSPNTDWYAHTDIVPRGTYVRNLAHGFIVLINNSPDPSDAATFAANLWRGPTGGLPTIMTADPLYTKHKFAALSWTWSYEFDSIDLPTLQCFFKQHAAFGLTQYVDGDASGNSSSAGAGS